MKFSIRLLCLTVLLSLLSFALSCSDNSTGPPEKKQDDKPVLVGFFKLDPRATYLHVCLSTGDPGNDNGSLNAVPLRLADHNIAVGDSLLLEVVGDFFNGANLRDRMVAVFSSSAALLGGGEAHRVPGAIEAGEDYVSPETFGCGGEPTDIPEDFYCSPTVAISVPAGATYLFVCARDSYYEDNTDDNNDFGIRILKVK